MPFLLYFLLFIIPLITGVILVIIAFNRKKNNHTELYSEGLYNENAGHYDLALHNYEDALDEMKKGKLGKKFHNKIVQKIKILKTTIDYEKNFQINHEASFK